MVVIKANEELLLNLSCHFNSISHLSTCLDIYVGITPVSTKNLESPNLNLITNIKYTTNIYSLHDLFTCLFRENNLSLNACHSLFPEQLFKHIRKVNIVLLVPVLTNLRVQTT